MSEPVYTAEFFSSLERMVDNRPHRCQQCKIVDGAKRLNRDGSQQKFGAIVRLCVVDKSKPATQMFLGNATNIGMFCTRCRKPDQVWKTPRRMKPSKLPQLFRSKLEEVQANARNKIQPKPPQVDDEGFVIPF